MPSMAGKPIEEYAHIARRAEVDPRTVKNVVLGKPTKRMVRLRIERVLREMGAHQRKKDSTWVT